MQKNLLFVSRGSPLERVAVGDKEPLLGMQQSIINKHFVTYATACHNHLSTSINVSHVRCLFTLCLVRQFKLK